MKRFLLFLLSFVTLVSSCRRDFENASWNSHAVTPLLKSSMSIDDVVGNDLVQKNNDNSIKVVYKEKLYSANTDSMLQFKDTTYTYGTSLESLILSNDSVVYPVTLGKIARDQGGLVGAFILSNQGNPFIFTAFNNISTSDIPLDGSAFFQSMEVLSGFMDITIDNGLPVDITTLDFELKNDPLYGGVSIANGSFPVIPSGTRQTLSYDLSGQTVYGKMIAKILTMSTAGSSGPVIIDTNNAVKTIVKIRDLKPKTAQAFFPDQEVFSQVQGINLTTADNMMLDKIKVQSGNVVVTVNSSIRDTIFFKYLIPNASKNNKAFSVDTFIAPAPPGLLVTTAYVFPFDGYEMQMNGFGVEQDSVKDYNGNGIFDSDTINTFVQILSGRIKAKNQMVELTLGDTFYVEAGLKSIILSQGSGYLGNGIMSTGAKSTKISAFDNYVSGSMALEDVKVDLEIVNGLGAQMGVDVDYLKTKNTKQNNTQTLTTAVFSTPLDVASAVNVPLGNSPVTATVYPITLNKGNSNIDDLIEIFPDSIAYNINVQLNSNTPVPTYQQVLANNPNFAYRGTGIDVNMNIELPLAFSTSNLTLSDTSDFTFVKSDATEAFQDGTFNLICDNGFPFTADITLYLLDVSGNKLDSLFKDGHIASANTTLVNSEWKVSSKAHSTLSFHVSAARMETLFNSKKILIIAKFNTANQPDYVKVYSDYSIDCKLTGDFNFKVKLKK